MSTPRHTTKLTETETPETSFDDDDVGGGDDVDNVEDEKHKQRNMAERFLSHTIKARSGNFQTHTQLLTYGLRRTT